jgi:hypothetical protein
MWWAILCPRCFYNPFVISRIVNHTLSEMTSHNEDNRGPYALLYAMEEESERNAEKCRAEEANHPPPTPADEEITEKERMEKELEEIRELLNDVRPIFTRISAILATKRGK